MKRAIVDINELASYYSLYNAWRQVSTGDGKDRRRDVIKYGENLDANLKNLSKRLIDGSWEPDKGCEFMLFTEGKWRKIHTVGVEDRIVHVALVRHFDLNRHFVKRTFGSIKKRGTLRASKQVRKDIRLSGYDYVIKMDVRKYYPNVIKSKLMDEIRRKYKGEAAIKLFEKVLMSYQPDSERGISIGALPSQNNGNFYLTPFDYYVLHVICLRYYTRYVDDITIMIVDKKVAREVIPGMKAFAAKYGLEFGKITVFPIHARRIDFCGYASNRDNTLLRKSTMRRFSRKLRRLHRKPCDPEYERGCVSSYLGLLKHSDGNIILTILKREHYEVFDRIDRYTEECRCQKDGIAGSSSRDQRVQAFFQSQGSRAKPGRNRRGQRATRYRSRALC